MSEVMVNEEYVDVIVPAKITVKGALAGYLDGQTFELTIDEVNGESFSNAFAAKVVEYLTRKPGQRGPAIGSDEELVTGEMEE